MLFADEVDRLSIMSMAGVTAEAQTFDEVHRLCCELSRERRIHLASICC